MGLRTGIKRLLAGERSEFGTDVTERDSNNPLYTLLHDEWFPRQVNPRLYETMREAVPPLDAAINRLVMLDGLIVPEAESDRLERETKDWMAGVRVNDLESGFQGFTGMMGDENYEQGFALAEPVYRADGRDIVELQIADSKGVLYKRGDDGRLETWYRPPSKERKNRDGMENIERLLRNNIGPDATLGNLGYTRIQRDDLVRWTHNPEAGSPYGVSLFRSMEFLAQLLVTIDNSLRSTWNRFGDPMFEVIYNTTSRDAEEVKDRRKQIEDKFKKVLEAKRNGRSADFVSAVGKEESITIKVIGGDQQVLELEEPARHVLEQLVAKTGLPSWMLGFHWSTAERLAGRQSEILLQESRTRWEQRRSPTERLVAAALRARGVTWNPGDWRLTQQLPNLSDEVAKAQAEFLRAQAANQRAMAPEVGTDPDDEGEDDDGGRGQRMVTEPDGSVWLRVSGDSRRPKGQGGHRHKESFVENHPDLPRLERATERTLVAAWNDLQARTLDRLGLGAFKGAKAHEDGEAFVFAAEWLDDLDRESEAFIETHGGADADLTQNAWSAWLIGAAAAAGELGVGDLETQVRDRKRRAMASDMLELVRNATVRDYRTEIVQALADGVYDGQNPEDVARQLRQRFGAQEYNWKRLAKTEISKAQARGKLTQYAENDLEEYEWITAPDACPICRRLRDGGPYLVGVGPTPGLDSHPECRCSVEGILPAPG